MPNWIAPGQPSSEEVHEGGLTADGRYAYWVTRQTYAAPYVQGPINLYRRRISAPQCYPLAVTIVGSARVDRVPAGAAQGATFRYGDTEQVTLTATPAQGWRFAGWSGVDEVAGLSALVQTHHPRNVSAHFEAMAAPTAATLRITTAEDTPSDPIAPEGIDADANDFHTVRIVTPPQNGSVEVRNGQIVYTPDPDFFGADSFTFQVMDRYGLELPAPATAQVTVTPVKDPPSRALATIATMANGGSVAVTPLVEHPDGESQFSFAILMPPLHGTAEVDGGQLRYTPVANFTGRDSFTFLASDSAGMSVVGIAIIDVTRAEWRVYLPHLLR